MFFSDRGYVQIVENKREGAAVRQRVIANLGRADEQAASGALASLLASGRWRSPCCLLSQLRQSRKVTELRYGPSAAR